MEYRNKLYAILYVYSIVFHKPANKPQYPYLQQSYNHLQILEKKVFQQIIFLLLLNKTISQKNFTYWLVIENAVQISTSCVYSKKMFTLAVQKRNVMKIKKLNEVYTKEC